MEASPPARVLLHGPGDGPDMGLPGRFRCLELKLARATFDRILLEDHALRLSAVAPLRDQQDYELLTLLARAFLVPAVDRPFAIRRVVDRLATYHCANTRRPHVRGLGPARLRRVMDRVASELDSITLDAMAAAAGLSVFHFAREFRREMGQTPWTVVTRCRVWEAIRLLGVSGMTIDDVAARVGFAHAGHLGRVFRQQLGAPPREVRRCLAD